MWVRGLKQKITVNTNMRQISRTPCGCVDWNSERKSKRGNNNVAPHVGAWIETNFIIKIAIWFDVAPHVGAWIETSEPWASALFEMSHPMWVRGLKLLIRLIDVGNLLSHPMWVRGLKQKHYQFSNHLRTSHPMWVRGLKLFRFCASLFKKEVAPHVGAWIETCI